MEVRRFAPTAEMGDPRESKPMGMFQVQVTVANPQDSTRSLAHGFWVDTGALYSYMPEGDARKIGLVPKATRDFILADGRKDRRMIGEALFTIEGIPETITCVVVFGPPESLFLLGATALENFGVQADPTTQRLLPVAALIGTFVATRTPDAPSGS